MIVVHGETLWSPAPQPMDDDDDKVAVNMTDSTCLWGNFVRFVRLNFVEKYRVVTAMCHFWNGNES